MWYQTAGPERDELGPGIQLGQLVATRITPELRGTLLLHIHQGMAGKVVKEYTEKLEGEQD